MNVPPLPEFEVVDRVLPKKRLAQYHERRKPRLIELSRPALAAVTAAERRYVIYHELGHWFRTEFVPMVVARNEEKFAHNFALYFAAPAALAIEDTNTYHEIKILVDGEEHRIKKFARKLLAV